jgi:hypothetical protein
MNFEKYYERCSQEDLLDVLDHLDKDAYPDRQKYVEKLFKARGGSSKLNEEKLLKSGLVREEKIATLRTLSALILLLISMWVLVSDFKINVTIPGLGLNFFIDTFFILAVLVLSIVSVFLFGHEKRSQLS